MLHLLVEIRDKKGPVEDGKVEMESISSRLGRTTIEISDLCKSYGDKVLVKDYTYFFLKDDRIGYIGPESGLTQPAIIFINVDFPLPLGHEPQGHRLY